MDEAATELLERRVEEKIEDIHDFAQIIFAYENKWNLDCKDDVKMNSMYLGKQYFLPEEDPFSDGKANYTPDYKKLNNDWEKERQKLCELRSRGQILVNDFGGRDEIEITDKYECNMKLSERLNRIIKQAYDGYLNISSYWRRYERIDTPTANEDSSDWDHPLFRSTTICLDDLSGYQQLLIVLLDGLKKSNYKRYHGWCCEEIITESRKKTRAWKRVYEIKEFVYRYSNKESSFDIWKLMTDRPSLANESIKYLNNCIDNQFRDVVKNRNMWSFNNGIFFANDPTKDKIECAFYEYGTKDFPGQFSCKYFDKFFDKTNCDISDWWDIETPYFKSVMDYQEFDKDVQKWMYVIGGRLCFNVGELDSWQVIPFLKGIAKSGKSTLITKVFKKFYENEDVKTLSNNIERKFGLSSICEGLMFIAPEVKGDLALEQAEFQSLVSGEDVSIAVKHEKAKSIEWTTPGILGGNEVPNWKDNSGSILRRMLTFQFGKQVKNADPQLDEKLDSEIPNILVKCIRAYLDYSSRYSNKDIWNITPAYFKKIQNQVAMVTSSLQNFLASEKVVYGSDKCVPQKIFTTMFFSHCQENNLGRPKFNEDFYAGAFSSRDVDVRVDSRVYKGQTYPPQSFIFGLDVVDDYSIEITDGDS